MTGNLNGSMSSAEGAINRNVIRIAVGFAIVSGELQERLAGPVAGGGGKGRLEGIRKRQRQDETEDDEDEQ